MNDGNKTQGNLELNMGGVYSMIIKGEKNMIDVSNNKNKITI
jgi:hypothetical protein